MPPEPCSDCPQRDECCDDADTHAARIFRDLMAARRDRAEEAG